MKHKYTLISPYGNEKIIEGNSLNWEKHGIEIIKNIDVSTVKTIAIVPYTWVILID